MTDDQEFIEKRMEGAIQTFNGLLLDFERKLLDTVSSQIKITVNGKIDTLRAENAEYHNKQQTEIEGIKKSLDERIKPFEETRTWFQDAKKGAGWVAGFLTSITIIGAAFTFIIKFLRQ